MGKSIVLMIQIPLNGSVVSGFETYVGGMNYTIDYGSGTVSEPWGLGNDNLAFDNLGNLWVQQDGDNHYMWLVEAGHTQTNPKVKIFARTPDGSEPTGVFFTPDHKFMFMSIQHPNSSNNVTTVPDAFYTPRAFDEDVVLVISLRQHLGFPLNSKLVDFWGKQEGLKVQIGWTTEGVENVQKFILERKDKIDQWLTIGQLNAESSLKTYQTNDLSPKSGLNYYRIKQVDFNGNTTISPTIEVPVERKSFRIFPNPASSILYFEFLEPNPYLKELRISSQSGKILFEKSSLTSTSINLEDFSPGIYIISVSGQGISFHQKWLIK